MGDQPNNLTLLTAMFAVASAAITYTTSNVKAQSTPTASSIQRQLGAVAPKIAPSQKRTVQQIKRNKQLRRIAPTVNIQSINFEFGAANIPKSERWKVQRIATAMRALLARNPAEIFLVEGHTDAVGSNSANLILSQRRAESLARNLRRFGVNSYALETTGYGEEDLLIQTANAEWRNRRVSLRRITDLVIQR